MYTGGRDDEQREEEEEDKEDGGGMEKVRRSPSKAVLFVCGRLDFGLVMATLLYGGRRTILKVTITCECCISEL